MAEPEVDIDDDDVGDIAIPAGPSTSKFFETVQDDFTELTFTDFSHLDEPVPGESDDDDDTRSIAARRLKGRRQRKKNHRRIVVSLCSCKYDVVAQAARGLGWRCTIDENEEYNLLWNDSYVPFDTIAALNKYQKTNHFPGMSELAKKNLLAKNLNRIAKALPGEFGFVPPTFILPGEAEPLKNWFQSQVRTPRRAAPTRARIHTCMRGAPPSPVLSSLISDPPLPQKRRPTLILKPDAGCQGRGIFLTKSLDQCLEVEGMIAQQYLPAPLLVDGYKFDMRLYVLVTSVSPLRVLLFKEGLARFCTERYRAPNESNMEDTYMHLTNFAINKHHEEFTIDEGGDGGHKRSISSLFAWLKQNGFPTERIWQQIRALIVKTLLAVQPHLNHVYHSLLGDDNVGFSCFEILGFDVLLDRKGKPWLLEVRMHTHTCLCQCTTLTHTALPCANR